jgi:hypothetical protein
MAVFVALTALVLLAPRATPRPSAVIPSATVASERTTLPVASSDQPRTGAPTPPGAGVSPTPTGYPPQPVGVTPTAVTIAPLEVRNPAYTPPPEFSVRGIATYYCRPPLSRCTRGYPDGWYAAAGPELRAWLGPDWRGLHVVVTDSVGSRVRVQLIDWCLCGGGHIIDLYWSAFAGLVNPVVVTVQ